MTRRLFLGLVPPAAASAVVAARTRSALGASVAHVYAPEDLHLTLAFLGDVETGAAQRVAAGFERAFAGAASVALRLGGTGAFPVGGHESVLWAGFDLEAAERAALLDLVARARRLAAESGIELPEHELVRPFVPHLTLARPRPRERVPPAFAALRFDLDWGARAVHLCESVGAGRPGGRYPARASVPLAGL